MLSEPLSLAAAALRLHTTPRMLRYREALGLLPPHRRRRYGSAELAAAAYAVEMEQTYDVSPKTLAFALRAVTDPAVRQDIVRLGELTGRLGRAEHAGQDGVRPALSSVRTPGSSR